MLFSVYANRMSSQAAVSQHWRKQNTDPRLVCLSVCVCVCLSVRDHIFRTTLSIFTKFFVHVSYGRGSVLWRHSDTLRIAGFMDDIIFAHKLMLLDVAARLRQRGSHRQRMLGTTSCSQATQWACWVFMTSCLHSVHAYIARRKWRVLKVPPQVTAPGAESAVYDCLVSVVPSGICSRLLPMLVDYVPECWLLVVYLAAGISKYSGGTVHYFPGFHSISNPAELEHFEVALHRYLTRKIGFEAVMRIRCTKG